MLTDLLLAASGGALAALLLASLQTRRVEKAANKKFALMADAIAELRKQGDAREAALSDHLGQTTRRLQKKLRQVQSDVKRVEMGAQSAAESDTVSSVEQAISLARNGETRDAIMRKTGLPADIIETISTLHAVRRH